MRSTTISTRAIQEIVDKLKYQRCRDSTRKIYHHVWNKFNQFFIRLDCKQISWEKRIVLFTGYLVDCKFEFMTIKSYLSVIRTVLKQDGVKISEDRFLLMSLTRACRLHNDVIRTRFPIRKGLLRLILKEMDNRFMNESKSQPYLAVLFKALFSTAYFGLFRVGELTWSPHSVKAKDVHIAKNKDKMLFILHTSKTHCKGNKPQRIKFSSTPLKVMKTEKLQFCPFNLLKTYINYRPKSNGSEEQFFVFKENRNVKPVHMQEVLRAVLNRLNLNGRLYNTHSLKLERCDDL